MIIKDKHNITFGDVVIYEGKLLKVVHEENDNCRECFFSSIPDCFSIINNKLGYKGVTHCNYINFIEVADMSSMDTEFIVISKSKLKKEVCSSDICPFSGNCDNSLYCMYKSILNKLTSY